MQYFESNDEAWPAGIYQDCSLELYGIGEYHSIPDSCTDAGHNPESGASATVEAKLVIAPFKGLVGNDLEFCQL